MKRIGRRRWVLAWFLLIGAGVYGIENIPVHDPAKTAASAVTLLYGGYEVILDRIANRDVKRENEDLRRQAEADAREKVELRRRIAELEQQKNGAK